MVDAHALGACGLGRAGSNPASPTSERFLEPTLRQPEGRNMLPPNSIGHGKNDIDACRDGLITARTFRNNLRTAFQNNLVPRLLTGVDGFQKIMILVLDQ